MEISIEAKSLNIFNFFSIAENEILNKMQRSSALSLCENADLLASIKDMIEKIATDSSARETLSKLPEATLPLSIAAQSTTNKSIQDFAIICLKELIAAYC